MSQYKAKIVKACLPLAHLLCINATCQVNPLTKKFVTAIKYSDITGVKRALAQGACANSAVATYCFPLTMAIYNDSHEIVGLLLAAGADPNLAHSTVYPNEKITCLYIASSKQNLPIVQLLLRAGANPNQSSMLFETDCTSTQERTPLQIAAMRQSESIVRELLLRGAIAIPNATTPLLPPEARTLIKQYLPLAAERNACILFVLEEVHHTPRDITRLICTCAGIPASHMPSAPGQTTRKKQSKQVAPPLSPDIRSIFSKTALHAK